MRILLLGGAGQVGTEIRAQAALKNFEAVAPGRGELDLQDASAIKKIVSAQFWHCIINAAGYTDVDRAETEQSIAFAVNAGAPALLAAETGRRGIPLIHISTDYVFDGQKGAPYVEQDEVGPLNVYGRSKLAGEQGIGAANSRHVILRTSWVYSPFRKNFVKTILRLATEQDRLKIVADQRGCPTAACDIAKASLEIAIRCVSKPEQARYGVYHFAGEGEASWFEFATVIVGMAANRLARCPKVVPTRTIDYPTPAIRPLDTRLNSVAVTRNFRVKLRPWRDALADTIDRLLTDRDIP